MAGKKSWLTSYYRLSTVGSISEKLSATCRRSVNGLFAVEIHRALRTRGPFAGDIVVAG
jgi:hypothetical protein